METNQCFPRMTPGILHNNHPFTFQAPVPAPGKGPEANAKPLILAALEWIQPLVEAC